MAAKAGKQKGSNPPPEDKAASKKKAEKKLDSTTGGSHFSFNFLLAFAVFPYLIGLYITHKQPWLSTWIQKAVFSPPSMSPSSSSSSLDPRLLSDEGLTCFQRFLKGLEIQDKNTDNPFKGLSLAIHRNGEPSPCGDTGNRRVDENDLLISFEKILNVDNVHCPDFQDKYQLESFLTRFLHSLVSDSCHSLEPDRTPELGLYGFCDMGVARTPVLLDHPFLVQNKNQNGESFLPCHFHTREGIRITNLSQFLEAATASANQTVTTKQQECETNKDGTCASSSLSTSDQSFRQLHLYAVPAGRMFMFAPAYIGEIFPLPHVTGADPSQLVYLEVMSLRPRVFELYNFFTRDESHGLIDRALNETRDSHRIKRSSTGAAGYTVNPQRTSESGYDTSSPTALAVMRRCFDVLGFDKFIESHADGLQMLRYNLTKSYNAHMDYIEGNDMLEHDYDSSKKGGNRFATILLYMTDLEESDGGETVFTEGWPVGQNEEDHVDLDKAIASVRADGVNKLLQPFSWEERMVALCRSRLSVRPRAGRSVLFYSQLPNGEEDRSSLHGGCPVLAGTKYAANLWVWNTPRVGYIGSPKNPNFKGTKSNDPPVDASKIAVFKNAGTNKEFDNAQLFFEENFWAKLGPKDPVVTVSTFEGNLWNLKVDGKTVKSWTIGKEKNHQFTI